MMALHLEARNLAASRKLQPEPPIRRLWSTSELHAMASEIPRSHAKSDMVKASSVPGGQRRALAASAVKLKLDHRITPPAAQGLFSRTTQGGPSVPRR